MLPLDGFNMDTWREKSILGHGSLIAKSCKGSMMLAGHSEEVQFKAFKFGEHMSLAWKVKNHTHEIYPLLLFTSSWVEEFSAFFSKSTSIFL